MDGSGSEEFGECNGTKVGEEGTEAEEGRGDGGGELGAGEEGKGEVMSGIGETGWGEKGKEVDRWGSAGGD